MYLEYVIIIIGLSLLSIAFSLSGILFVAINWNNYNLKNIIYALTLLGSGGILFLVAKYLNWVWS